MKSGKTPLGGPPSAQPPAAALCAAARHPAPLRGAIFCPSRALRALRAARASFLETPKKCRISYCRVRVIIVSCFLSVYSKPVGPRSSRLRSELSQDPHACTGRSITPAAHNRTRPSVEFHVFSKTSTCSISKPPSWSYAGGGMSDSTEAPVALCVLAGCGAVTAPLTVTSDMRAMGGGTR